MAACNAVGEFVPPMILFPGERLRDVGLSGFPGAIYATTKNGWMDTDTFVAYVEKLVEFAKTENIEFPIILFVDGHSTHMSLEAAEYCKSNGVILYCLVANATHIMQPLDIGFFSPMKQAWKRSVKQWQLENYGIPLSKKEFPALLKQTWEKVATFENAAHGFRKAGLFPLTIDGIDTSKLGPSKMLQQKQKNDVQVEEDKENEKQPIAGVVEKSVDLNDNQTGTTGQQTTRNEEIHKIVSGNYVAPAFSELRIPEIKLKAKSSRLAERLPKAISGTKALEMLKERERQKKEQEIAKVQRKEEREKKRIEREAEKERKKQEREAKKKQPKSKKPKTKPKKRSRESDESDENLSESEYNTTDLFDDDSSDYEEEFEMCPGCNKGDQHPSRWVKCEECMTRWHFMCANRPEFELLEPEERKKMSFVCPLCA